MHSVVLTVSLDEAFKIFFVIVTPQEKLKLLVRICRESNYVAGDFSLVENSNLADDTMRRLNFSMDVFIAFIDAGLLLMERYFEVEVLVNYHNNGDVWWFWLTLTFICLPGVIFIGLNLFSAIKDQSNLFNLLVQSIKYGLLFPLTTLIR